MVREGWWDHYNAQLSRTIRGDMGHTWSQGIYVGSNDYGMGTRRDFIPLFYWTVYPRLYTAALSQKHGVA